MLQSCDQALKKPKRKFCKESIDRVDTITLYANIYIYIKMWMALV